MRVTAIECACRGCLQPAPIRTVLHGGRRCVSIPHDGSATTAIEAKGACLVCPKDRGKAADDCPWSLCATCTYEPVLPAVPAVA